MKLGILILNYLAFKDTMECIDSIKSQSFKEWEIIVVDNSSQNGSFEILYKKYLNEPNISVIQTPMNLGFAKGNNFGLNEFSKKNIYKVLVINGDTILNNSEYLQKISDVEYSSNVGMIGTKIQTKDEKNQNPINVDLVNRERIKKNKIELIVLKFLVYSHLFRIISFVSKKILRKTNDNKKEKTDSSTLLNPSTQMLHGAAILFTEHYLTRYLGFYPETFLYYEEEFLALICRKFGFYQLYVPSAEIYHKEDASSTLLFSKNQLKSLKFKLKIITQNIKLYKKVFSYSKKELEEVMLRK